ncbi:hypothetical protein CDCA_CDCA08G2530 [Cyanidium caldarium]|uniref:Pentapeptide repeat-containing protein n=1 Tax=Cyanidium caldarium TaxID=2771 RepID=A0AAV9IWN2_CYACA|nr:hypothetical protein CDCA_CDCA08G2530 [Cyanidium caldarium]
MWVVSGGNGLGRGSSQGSVSHRADCGWRRPRVTDERFWEVGPRGGHGAVAHEAANRNASPPLAVAGSERQLPRPVLMGARRHQTSRRSWWGTALVRSGLAAAIFATVQLTFTLPGLSASAVASALQSDRDTSPAPTSTPSPTTPEADAQLALLRQRLTDTRKCPMCDLSSIDLSGAALSGADLHGSDLRAARLHNAQLSGANLRGADLRQADLTEAALDGAELASANLTQAVLQRALLLGAHVSENTSIEGADFRSAIMDRATARRWCSIASGTNAQTQVETRASLECDAATATLGAGKRPEPPASTPAKAPLPSREE